MIAVQELKLQIIPLTYSWLEFSSGLNECALCNFVKNLHFFDYFLLILNDLVLLIYFSLDSSDLNLLLIGLELDESFQVGDVSLSNVNFMLFCIDNSSDTIDLSVQVLLTVLVVSESRHETVNWLLSWAFQVRYDLFSDARTVS